MERRLGRGLGSLLSDRDEAKAAAGSPAEIDIAVIRPNPFQPRRQFDAEGLDELAASLRTHGLLQPIVVRKIGAVYELIAGERRLRAAQQVGLQRLAAVVKTDVPDDQMLELALVENVQRRDLNPIERALGYRNLLDRLALTQEEVAQRVGLNRATVANHLRLLELPTPVQEALSRGALSMGHARALLGLPGRQERLDLANRAIGEGLSVRDVERIVREALGAMTAGDAGASGGTTGRGRGDDPSMDGDHSPAFGGELPPWVATLQDRLQDALGTKVELKTRPGYTGQIIIHYFDRADLDRLLDQLAPLPGV